MADERQVQQYFELLQSKEFMEPTDRFVKLHRKSIYIWLTLFGSSEKIQQYFGDQGVFTSFLQLFSLFTRHETFFLSEFK